jgi:hypothetical protein
LRPTTEHAWHSIAETIREKGPFADDFGSDIEEVDEKFAWLSSKVVAQSRPTRVGVFAFKTNANLYTRRSGLLGTENIREHPIHSCQAV